MRRFLLMGSVAGLLLVLGAWAARTPRPELPLLAWAQKAALPPPPIALLLEMGLQDRQPQDWSGRAVVQGARVVRREGYRFRKEDRLLPPDGWQAASHWGLRVPPRAKTIAQMEGLASVGVVWHLEQVQADATLTITRAGQESAPLRIPLKEVLSGRRLPLWGGQAVLRRISSTAQLTEGATEDDYPAAAYGPDGTLWLAYVSYTLRDPSRRIEQQPYRTPPKDFRHLYHPELAEQLFLRCYRAGRWSAPLPLTSSQESIARCALTVSGAGTVWVAYSALREGKHAIYVRAVVDGQPQAEHCLTPAEGPHLTPVMATDRQGVPWLACQSWQADGNALVTAYRAHQDQWQRIAGLEKQSPAEHAWHPALATGPSGQVALAYDHYAQQRDYDVAVLPCAGQTPQGAVAASARFEARPSACYDLQGRLWIAYEEGPEHWGKDSGALVRKGNPLYTTRAVRVVCFDKGRLWRPVAELPVPQVTNPGGQSEMRLIHHYESASRYTCPQLGLDGKGRLWLVYRQQFGSRYTTHAGSYWLAFARRLDGDHWSEPLEVHHSDGLLDQRSVLLPHPAGGLLIIHNGDGRYTEPETVHNHLFWSYVDLPGEPQEPKLVPHEAGHKPPDAEAVRQAEAVRRLRSYRLEQAGKRYRLLAGEFHRHTEISWDGGGDGSLEDMFRYALDAAGLDWIGNGDHDNGSGREYSWWLIQKYTDAYLVPGVFTPVFCYERSVPYPHGHRNCLFAQRGVMTLPRLAPPSPKEAVGGVHADDTKMLYRYLHELGGLCASHTPTTGMGTDWRDNDPEVEPVVEIYQGDRMSSEYYGAPRAGYDPKSGKQPANIGGWHPEGFVNVALKDKGYRLGFECSSDHWSTHISYCMVWVERTDRRGILEALRRRHCYGATDHILLDVRSGSHLMGDAFSSAAPPTLALHVVGTAPLARLDIHRDSQIVATLRPQGQEYHGIWTDPAPQAGTHYYYVRVWQTDGELAWGSPLWITRE
jgi:hypothetical protein